MRMILALLFSAMLFGCGMTIPEYSETRFNRAIELAEWNSVLNRYENKPAFVKVLSNKNENHKHNKILSIEAAGYGYTYTEYTGVTQSRLFISVTETEAQILSNAIDKYIQWNQQAIDSGDMFTKVIAQTKEGDSYTDALYHRFDFYSANATSHHLMVYACSTSTVLKNFCNLTAVLDRSNAEKLSVILDEFLSGSLQVQDVGAKYN